MTKNTTSNYNDIISKSVLIHSGSPAVYQLKPKKDNIGTLRRMTLGEKDPNKTNRTILLVGETGAGKSALVNALVNYTMGVKWEDDVWFQIIEEEKTRQTSDVIMYQIFGFEDQTLPYSLTIIDTPGYGDTRGTERDDIISERLLEWFSSDDGVHEINAVGLVLKATDNRLSDRLRYIFDSVVSLFGKDIEKKIVALVTHSDGRTPKNALKALKAANIKCAKDEENEPVYFLFNNCQHEDRTEDTEVLKHSDEITTKGMSQFTNLLETTAPETLEITVHVLNQRIRLKANIQNLQERIEWIQHKQREIQQTLGELKKHEQEMKNNEEFTVKEVHKEIKDMNGRRWSCGLLHKEAVCCTECKENCHYLGYSMAQSLEHCQVMKDGCCTVCGCSVSKHVKENWIYVNKTRTITIEDMKKKFEQSKSDCEEKKKHLGKLTKEMEELQKEKDQMLDESFDHVTKLEQIALNVDSLSTLVHLDFLIEKMKEKGDREKVQKLKEMKRHADERRNTSWKFKDIISKSDLIQSGSPAVYQLKPKEEKIGTPRRMNLKRTNKTILLVGEIGTGKSTLINTLVNYTMGVKWEDDVWFQIVEEDKRRFSESQTSDVIVYQIFGFANKTLPYSLTIIDTPGYGSTGGIEHDDFIRNRLLDWFSSDDGVHEINAVGLVMKASDNQLNNQLKDIFNSEKSLFGKNMEKNIVALITHSDGRTPKNALKALEAANIQCAQDEKNQPLYFLFDNCQHEDRTTDTEILQRAVRKTAEGTSQFINFLKKTEPRNLETIVQNEQSRLDNLIKNLQKQIVESELQQGESLQTGKCQKTLQDEIHKEATNQKDPLLESFQHVDRLHQISTNVNPLSTYVHLDFLIEKMKEKGDTEKVQKLEEMKRRVDERTREGLEAFFKKITGAEKHRILQI